MKYAAAVVAFLFIWSAATILLCLPIASILTFVWPTKFAVKFGNSANFDRFLITVGSVSAIIGILPAIHSARATIRMAATKKGGASSLTEERDEPDDTVSTTGL
jgi:hypothetical protein